VARFPREAGLPFSKSGSVITFGVSMADPTPTNPYTWRWHTLLAENTAIEDEHLEFNSLFTPPFSVPQTVRMSAIGARGQELALKLHDLVEEWQAAAGAHET
jgi:hypothetical protein